MEVKRNSGDLIGQQVHVQKILWNLISELKEIEEDDTKKDTIAEIKLKITAYTEEYNLLEVQLKKVYEKYFANDCQVVRTYNWKNTD